MTVYYVTCEGPDSQGYCVDVFARYECSLIDLCPSCLGWVMSTLDLAAGTELPWASEYRRAAGSTGQPRAWVSTRRPIDAARERAAAMARRVFRRSA